MEIVTEEEKVVVLTEKAGEKVDEDLIFLPEVAEIYSPTLEDEDEGMQCLNCEKRATVQEQEEKENVFCSPHCQEIYRQPHRVCQLVDTKHTVHTLDRSTVTITPWFSFRVVNGNEGEIALDPLHTRIIRVETGKLVVNVYDRNKALCATYILSASNADQIVIPQSVYHSLGTHEKGGVTKVSILLNKQ